MDNGYIPTIHSCYRFSLKAGTLMILWTYMLISIYFIIISFTTSLDLDLPMLPPVDNILVLVACISGLYAVYKEKRSYLLPTLMLTYANLLIITIFGVYWLIDCFRPDKMSYTLYAIDFKELIFNFFVSLFFSYVVYSYYKQMKVEDHFKRNDVNNKGRPIVNV